MRKKISDCTSDWELDSKTIFLNHGSFGACPKKILDYQTQLRLEMERSPVQFMTQKLLPLLDKARIKLAEFIGANPNNLCFVSNATTGINTVLRSIKINSGDELLVTDHEYNATRNALNFVAKRSQAKIVVAKVPFPLSNSEEITSVIIEKISERTKLVLLDHITSPTGIIFPIQKIINILSEREIDILIDGAHAPGSIPLNLQKIGATYYTGNCHKWMCSPKGAAFLYVREDKKHLIRPLTISHGANQKSRDRDLFRLEFDWTGTDDFTSYLCVSEAIDFLNSFREKDCTTLMNNNTFLALEARNVLCQSLGIAPPVPSELIASMVSLPLPKKVNYSFENERLQALLYSKYSI